MNLLFSCIGRRGYIADYFRPHLAESDRIIGTSNTESTPGFRSCDAGVLMPDIRSQEYVPTMLELCRAENIDGFLSFFDLDVLEVSQHVDTLREAGVVPIIPGHDAARACFDKVETSRFLAERGFPTARTVAGYDAATDALARGEFSFPVIVKPRNGFGSRNTLEARTEEELKVFCSLEDDMIVQEKLVGDMYDVEVCTDLNGRALAVVPWRKLASRLGETEHVVTCDEPALIDFGVRLAEAVQYPGPLDADLFVCDGVIFTLEINLRFGGGYPASHLAGADFPGLIVQMIRGEQPEPRIGEFRAGVVMMKELHAFGGDEALFGADVLHITRDLRNDAK